jgi:hypothetical protein
MYTARIDAGILLTIFRAAQAVTERILMEKKRRFVRRRLTREEMYN